MVIAAAERLELPIDLLKRKTLWRLAMRLYQPMLDAHDIYAQQTLISEMKNHIAETQDISVANA